MRTRDLKKHLKEAGGDIDTAVERILHPPTAQKEEVGVRKEKHRKAEDDELQPRLTAEERLAQMERFGLVLDEESTPSTSSGASKKAKPCLLRPPVEVSCHLPSID